MAAYNFPAGSFTNRVDYLIGHVEMWYRQGTLLQNECDCKTALAVLGMEVQAEPGPAREEGNRRLAALRKRIDSLIVFARQTPEKAPECDAASVMRLRKERSHLIREAADIEGECFEIAKELSGPAAVDCDAITHRLEVLQERVDRLGDPAKLSDLTARIEELMFSTNLPRDLDLERPTPPPVADRAAAAPIVAGTQGGQLQGANAATDKEVYYWVRPERLVTVSPAALNRMGITNSGICFPCSTTRTGPVFFGFEGVPNREGREAWEMLRVTEKQLDYLKSRAHFFASIAGPDAIMRVLELFEPLGAPLSGTFIRSSAVSGVVVVLAPPQAQAAAQPPRPAAVAVQPPRPGAVAAQPPRPAAVAAAQPPQPGAGGLPLQPATAAAAQPPRPAAGGPPPGNAPPPGERAPEVYYWIRPERLEGIHQDLLNRLCFEVEGNLMTFALSSGGHGVIWRCGGELPLPACVGRKAWEVLRVTEMQLNQLKENTRSYGKGPIYPIYSIMPILDLFEPVPPGTPVRLTGRAGVAVAVPPGVVLPPRLLNVQPSVPVVPPPAVAQPQAAVPSPQPAAVAAPPSRPAAVAVQPPVPVVPPPAAAQPPRQNRDVIERDFARFYGAVQSAAAAQPPAGGPPPAAAQPPQPAAVAVQPPRPAAAVQPPQPAAAAVQPPRPAAAVQPPQPAVVVQPPAAVQPPQPAVVVQPPAAVQPPRPAAAVPLPRPVAAAAQPPGNAPPPGERAPEVYYWIRPERLEGIRRELLNSLKFEDDNMLFELSSIRHGVMWQCAGELPLPACVGREAWEFLRVTEMQLDKLKADTRSYGNDPRYSIMPILDLFEPVPPGTPVRLTGRAGVAVAVPPGAVLPPRLLNVQPLRPAAGGPPLAAAPPPQPAVAAVQPPVPVVPPPAAAPPPQPVAAVQPPAAAPLPTYEDIHDLPPPYPEPPPAYFPAGGIYAQALQDVRRAVDMRREAEVMIRSMSNVGYGNVLCIRGEPGVIPDMSWEREVPMTYENGGWVLRANATRSFEYKFGIRSANGEFRWEAYDGNRQYHIGPQ